MSPAADPPLSSATLGGAWKVTCLGTAGVNPALGSTLHLISRGGQMSPAADPPLSSATLGGAWKVTSLGTAGVNPALGSTLHLISRGGQMSPAAGGDTFPFFPPSGPRAKRLVVAKTPLGPRTKPRGAALMRRGVTPAPPQAFFDVNLVAGKGARVDIPADSPVTANLIAQSPDLLSSSDVTYLPIPSGFVAVTVPTSEQTGVRGYVQLGDRITILATVSSSVFGASPGVPVVRTVFRQLNVIRVGPAPGPTGSQQLTTSLTPLD